MLGLPSNVLFVMFPAPSVSSVCLVPVGCLPGHTGSRQQRAQESNIKLRPLCMLQCVCSPGLSGCMRRRSNPDLQCLRVRVRVSTPTCCSTLSDSIAVVRPCAGWFGAGAPPSIAARVLAEAQPQGDRDTWRALEALLRLTTADATIGDTVMLQHSDQQTHHSMVRCARVGTVQFAEQVLGQARSMQVCLGLGS